MYYDITNTKVLHNERQARSSRPNLSLPINLSAVLAEINIAPLTYNTVTPDEYQVIEKGSVIENEGEYLITDTLVDKPLMVCINEQVANINATTGEMIVEIATPEKQNNYQAKYTELLEKKFDDIEPLTETEVQTMSDLKELWITIEALVNTGNDREVRVAACTTIDAIKTIMEE